MPLSKWKEYGFKALEAFNELAQPEIKNRVFSRIWEYLRGYSAKKILSKPDEEIRQKLYHIFVTLKPMFADLEQSAEIQEMENMGSVKIPRVGELAKKINLVELDENKLSEIMARLKKNARV